MSISALLSAVRFQLAHLVPRLLLPFPLYKTEARRGRRLRQVR